VTTGLRFASRAQTSRSENAIQGVVAVAVELASPGSGPLGGADQLTQDAKRRAGRTAEIRLCVSVDLRLEVGEEPGRIQPFNFTDRRIGV
jgi:hypothetical protein